MDKRHKAWLTLALMPCVSPRTLWKLYNHFGDPVKIFSAQAEDLRNVPGIRPATMESIINRRLIRDPEGEFERLSSVGVNFLCWEDEKYPEPLRYIPDPPLFIFMKGQYEPMDVIAVAIVGTRYPSSEGMAMAEKLAEGLASKGVTVVSGLAIGIDAAAHRGALKAGGRTIAVLGCGVDVSYPKANLKLKEKIAQRGALFSEYPLGTYPEKWHFPLRNRIISGLSLGVMVVEAGYRSGALITARLALEQGRDVFAVPGHPGNFRSMGTNALIKEGAKLVQDVDDVFDELEVLRNLKKQDRPVSTQPTGGKDNDGVSRSEKKRNASLYSAGLEQLVMDLISDEPCHVDILCRKLGVPPREILPVLSTLEVKGCVNQLPGKYFTRKRR